MSEYRALSRFIEALTRHIDAALARDPQTPRRPAEAAPTTTTAPREETP